MAAYRIYRLRESVRQQFRWSPHTIGLTMVKPKDYEQILEVQAAGPYAVWMQLKDTEHALQVGDILEVDSGELRIYKYVGFEEAQWLIPEVKSGLETAPLASGPPTAMR